MTEISPDDPNDTILARRTARALAGGPNIDHVLMGAPVPGDRTIECLRRDTEVKHLRRVWELRQATICVEQGQVRIKFEHEAEARPIKYLCKWCFSDLLI